MHHPAKIKRALISVSDKTGIVAFASELHQRGIEIISTGGTAALIKAADIPVTDISTFTGFPEMMEGRLKTLHPKVHGGILNRRDQDADVMQAHDIQDIDLVVVNLYPFESTISQPGCQRTDAIEQIDIGGPTMLRAAAKNHTWVAAVVDPQDYNQIIAAFDQHAGELPAKQRYALAVKVFAHTAAYDGAIANYLSQQDFEGMPSDFPAHLNVALTQTQALRYGENPQQKAALYIDRQPEPHTLTTATLLQGKPLSYNNLADGDAALACVKQFEGPSCVIVKHANPCGIATATDLLSAYEQAFKCDPESSFGGIIAFNQPVDDVTVQAILDRQFVEVIIAPDFSEAAQTIAAEKKNLRLLATGQWTIPAPTTHQYDMKRIHGGLLVQTFDQGELADSEYKIVSEVSPTPEQMNDLKFALKAVKYVKSNAIVLAKSAQTIGIGAGQMSRVFALKIAEKRAKAADFSVTGAVLASDAFFPFRDSIDIAASMGIKAIIQPGGSKRDPEVIAAANEHGIALVFIPHRHFKH